MIKFLIKSGITDPDAALGIREILEKSMCHIEYVDDQSFLSPIRIGSEENVDPGQEQKAILCKGLLYNRC